jgi:hypothetical protein
MYEFVGMQAGGGGLQEIVGFPPGMFATSPHFRYASYPVNRPGMGAWRAGGAAGSGFAYVGADGSVTAPDGTPIAPPGSVAPNGLSGPTAQVVGPQVAAVQPRNVREFAIGFGPTNPAVNPNTTVIVAAQPQILFRGSRLVIPSSYGSNAVAQNFLINDIRVGKDSQFVSAGPLPGLAYLENAVGTAMGLDTCNVGQLITLNVTNLDMTNAHTFYATMFGTSVQ